MTELSKEEAGRQALLALSAIMMMSDKAERLGGATSLAGVAALHAMQTSLQKNGPRLAKITRVLFPEVVA